MRIKPCVSVIMPVHNEDRYISYAIESVLSQSFEDYEFIIIDDASTDHTCDIISNYNDKRIVFLHNNIKMGIAASLNKGLWYAKGEFIARMDGDDICKEKRLEQQISYMKFNTNIGICGSHIEIIDEKGRHIKYHKKETGSENIKIGLFFGRTSLAHPSIIIRRTLLDEYFLRYDQAFYYAEDYDLYCRSSQVILMDNIPHALIKYRVHAESVSQKNRVHQLNDARIALYLHLRRLGIDWKYDDYLCHSKLFLRLPFEQALTHEEKNIWLDKLMCINNTHSFFNTQLFLDKCNEVLNLNSERELN